MLRLDNVPAERRADVEPVLRELARKVAREDLKLEPVTGTIAEPGAARSTYQCPKIAANTIVDVEALVQENTIGHQGGHFGELRLAIVDCVASTVRRANDDTLGRPYENLDGMTAREFADAFSAVAKLVLDHLRQK